MQRIRNLFGAAVVTLAAVGIAGCGGGGGGGGGAPAPAPTPTPSPPPATSGTVNGLVYSAANGAAVPGATATVVGVAPATSNAQGSFQLAGVAASERVVLRVAAPGFVDALAVAAVRQGAVTLARVTLLPVGTSAAVNPANAVTVGASDSPAQVQAAANSFVRADNGAAPSGNLTVRLTAIDPARGPERMPGDYSTGSGASAQQIESFGAIAVEVRDAANNAYNLGTGKSATIRIPVSTREASPPASIPLFYLDESTGGWVEQGTATLAGSGSSRYYEGAVTHFSYWNADRVYEAVFINGCVQSSAGIGTRNRTVRTDGLDYSGAAQAFSDGNGEFRVALRKNSQAVLTVSGGTEATPPTVVGPLAADATLPACLVERGNVTTLPPTILAQPFGVTVDENNLARFTVVADGATPLRYQWRRNGVDIAGATGASHILFATGTDNGAVFSVVVSNAVSSVASANATLTVNVPNVAPTISLQPGNVTVQAGQVAAFSVSASGAQPLSYQWRRNGTPIASANAATYVAPATTLADDGATFDVVVSNNLGSVTSNAATLNVTSAQPAAGTYKRALAGLLAATYNAGCVNGAGAAAAPIVIAQNGDVSWSAGSMPMSSLTAQVSVSNGYGAFGVVSSLGNHTITDTSVNRVLTIATNRTAQANTSSAEVAQNSPHSRIVLCDPGVSGGIPQPNIVGLVSNWLHGTNATNLSCTVTVGSTKTTQSLNFSAAGSMATLGSLTIPLSATRIADSALANDVNFGPSIPADSNFAYTAVYSDSSIFSVGRWVTSLVFLVSYTTSGGTNYTCTGNRQP